MYNQDKYKVYRVPTDKIKANPAQPRKDFDENDLLELKNSIIENGIIQPLTVRKNANGNYEIIAGERRYRAAVEAGYNTIPCIIVSCDDKQAMLISIIENMQRKDLNVFEEASGIKNLIKAFSLTEEEAAQRLGISQACVANKLRLLKLTQEEMDIISAASLTERHARALLKIQDEKDRIIVLKELIKRKYNVVQSEKYIKEFCEKGKVSKKRKIVIKDIRIFLNTINHALKTMEEAGLNSKMEKVESDEDITIKIIIPKNKAVVKK